MTTDPYSLDKMVDIVSPDPVSWWPPAIGWWFASAAVGTWVASTGVIFLRGWRRQAYRREAIVELDRIVGVALTDTARSHAVPEISRLLKRVALTTFGRHKVAALTGSHWAEFLAATSRAGTLDPAVGRAIGTATYDGFRHDVVSGRLFEQIEHFARTWIQNHEEGGEDDRENRDQKMTTATALNTNSETSSC